MYVDQLKDGVSSSRVQFVAESEQTESAAICNVDMDSSFTTPWFVPPHVWKSLIIFCVMELVMGFLDLALLMPS